MTRVSLAALAASLLLVSATTAAASPLAFHVDVTTSPLIGSALGPFSLDFQLIDGGGTATNTVSIQNFEFFGGSPTGVETAFGGATGNLSAGISLTDAGPSFFNDLFQGFTPGSHLRFDVTISDNAETGGTPDAFSFGILDGSLLNLQTNGLGDALLLVNISGALRMSDVLTYTTRVPEGINVTVQAIPEPVTLALVGTGLLLAGRRGRRRR